MIQEPQAAQAMSGQVGEIVGISVIAAMPSTPTRRMLIS
jgi:hypothetical protein